MTYNFIDHTNRSHPILGAEIDCVWGGMGSKVERAERDKKRESKSRIEREREKDREREEESERERARVRERDKERDRRVHQTPHHAVRGVL